MTQNIHSMVRYQRNKVYLEKSQRSRVQNLLITIFYRLIVVQFDGEMITEKWKLLTLCWQNVVKIMKRSGQNVDIIMPTCWKNVDNT